MIAKRPMQIRINHFSRSGRRGTFVFAWFVTISTLSCRMVQNLVDTFHIDGNLYEPILRRFQGETRGWARRKPIPATKVSTYLWPDLNHSFLARSNPMLLIAASTSMSREGVQHVDTVGWVVPMMSDSTVATGGTIGGLLSRCTYLSTAASYWSLLLSSTAPRYNNLPIDSHRTLSSSSEVGLA